MDDRRPSPIKVAMIVRRDFRDLFGSEQSDKWGFFVDHHLSAAVHSFADWIEYPKGDHVFYDKNTRYFHSAVICSDGQKLFVCRGGESIIAWDMLNQLVIHEWAVNIAVGFRCLAYHSGLLVSSEKDSRIRVWDEHDYHLIHTLLGHTKQSRSVSFNSIGTLIVSVSLEQSIRVWSSQTGVCLKVIPLGSVNDALFIGNRLILNDDFQVWDSLDDFKLVRKIEEERPPSILAMRVNREQSMVCVICPVELIVLRWPEMTVIRKFQIHSFGVDFHPSQPDILAIGDNFDYSVRLYRISNGERIAVMKGHSDRIYSVVFTPDATRLVSGSWDKSFRIWDLSFR